MRLHADGTLDESFDPGPPNGQLECMALQPDGRVLVSGSFSAIGGGARTNLARLLPTGAIDPGFTAAQPVVARVLLVQPDGRIVLGGQFSSFGGRTVPGLARMHPGGEVDEEFRPDFASSGASNATYALALQPDGRILAGGQFTVDGRSRTLVRLYPQGPLDPSFDADTVAASHPLGVRHVFLEPGGGIIADGNAGLLNSPRRLRSDGAPDPSFAPVGYLAGAPLALLADGGVLIVAGGPLTYTDARVVKAIGGQLDDAGPPEVGFVTAGFSVNEAAGRVVVEVVRRGGNVGALSVDYTTSDGNARAGVDYTAQSGTLSFAPREVVKRIEVPIADNAIIDGRRVFSISLINAPPSAALYSSATVAIEDDARPGQFGWEVAAVELREGAAEVTLKARRTLGADGRSAVEFFTLARNASSGEDFSSTEGTLVFEDGEMEKSVTILLGDDAVSEGDESFSVHLRNAAGGAVIGLRHTAVITIADNDDPGSLARAVGLAAGTRVLAAGTQPDGKVIVAGSIQFDGEPTARVVGRLFQSGSVDSAFVAPPLTGEARAVAVQGDGRIVLGGAFSLNGNPVAVVRLTARGALDSTFTPPATSALDAVSAVALQSDGKVIVAGAVPGVSGAPVPYLVRLRSDGTPEGAIGPALTESIRELVVGPDDAIYFGTAGPRVVRLRADGSVDPGWTAPLVLPPFWVLASVVTCLAIDGDGRVLVSGNFFTDGPAQRPYLARLRSDGSIDPSFDARDYVKAPVEAIAFQSDGRILVASDLLDGWGNVLRLLPGGALDPTFRALPAATQAHGSFHALSLLDDSHVLVGGTFTRIDAVDVPGLAVLHIGPPAAALRFAAIVAPTVAEDAGSVTVAVRRVGSTAGAATVAYRTRAGAAVADRDFVSESGTLDFANGESVRTFSVDLIDDELYELPERFRVELFAATGARVWPSQDVLEIEIADDDPPRASTVRWTAATASVSENDGVISLEVVRTGAADGVATVNFATAPGTARGDDFVPASGTVTFPHGVSTQRIEIVIAHDALLEGPENFNVVLSAPGPGVTLGKPVRATVTIRDPDIDTIALFRGRYPALLHKITDAAEPGLLLLTIGARGAVTGTLTYGTQRLGFRGVLDASGRLELTLPRRDANPVRLQLQLDLAATTTRAISGTVNDVGLISAFSAQLQSFHPRQNPAESTGRYTLALTPSAGGSAPVVHSYALATIGAGGAVALVGKLSDGTPFTRSATLGQDQRWPLFVPLSAGRGLLAGDVQLTSGARWDLTGTLRWSKPAAFDIPLNVSGSTVTAPLVAETATLRITLTGGGLAMPVIAVPLTRLGPAKFSGLDGLTLSFHAMTGFFTGQFTHPVTHRTVRLQGVILPDENRGAGFFGAPTAGAVELEIAP